MNISILIIQSFKTFVQVEINKVLHGSGIEDRHLVAELEKASAVGFFSSCHPVDTLIDLWDKKHQQYQHRNTLKTGSLSEKVIKEDERVPFHP